MGFDIQQYTGLWHEYARYPSIYENDCQGAQAEYFFDTKQNILRVKNSCLVGGQIIRSDWGTARPTDQDGILLLKFDRFGPDAPETPYCVLFTDYQNYALVGSQKLNYFWILLRKPVVSDEEISYLNEKAREFGFDPQRFIRNPEIHKIGSYNDPIAK